MMILRVLLMTREVARPDIWPPRERRDSDRLTVQGWPQRAGSFSFPGTSTAQHGGAQGGEKGESSQGSVGGEPTGKVAQAADQAGKGEGRSGRRHHDAGNRTDRQVGNDCRGTNRQGSFHGPARPSPPPPPQQLKRRRQQRPPCWRIVGSNTGGQGRLVRGSRPRLVVRVVVAVAVGPLVGVTVAVQFAMWLVVAAVPVVLVQTARRSGRIRV